MTVTTAAGISDEGALHIWQQHGRQCPLTDHAYDNAAPEATAEKWLQRIWCPCDTVSVLRCAGCHETLMYVVDRGRGMCHHLCDTGEER